jgi:formyl-CoA transferase
MTVSVTDPDGRPVDLVGSPFQIAGSSSPAVKYPPLLGQHTAEVLKEFVGLDDAAVAGLRAKGVV